MNVEFDIQEDKVLVFHLDELDPDGNPVVVELSHEEYQQIYGDSDGT